MDKGFLLSRKSVQNGITKVAILIIMDKGFLLYLKELMQGSPNSRNPYYNG